MLNYTLTHTQIIIKKKLSKLFAFSVQRGNLLKTALRKNKSNHFKPDLATEIIIDEELGRLICTKIQFVKTILLQSFLL